MGHPTRPRSAAAAQPCAQRLGRCTRNRPQSGTWEADQVWSAQGYATGSGPGHTYTLVDPVSIRKQDKQGRTTDSIVSARTSGSGKLSAGDSFAQGDWKRWSSTQYDGQGRVSSTRVYHTIPASGTGSAGTNYGQSDFGYDAMNRQNRVRSPGGTIARTLYDARGRVASVWVGTDDEPTSGQWSPGNLTGTDMKSGCLKGRMTCPASRRGRPAHIDRPATGDNNRGMERP